MNALTLTLIALAVIAAVVTVSSLWATRRVKSDMRPAACSRGEHDFRVVAAPYVRQCREVACGLIVYEYDERGDFPDGLKEYVEIMTRTATPLPGDFQHTYRPDEALLARRGANLSEDYLREDYALLPCRICGRKREGGNHVLDSQ